ncbi:MAG: CoA transferase [Flavobacteriales bacterium]|nr:CoA transferase [Flavobacteriales bacterium]
MIESHPLKGIKVIELANVLAGPAVGMFLAELGAEVIKIENRLNGGDMTRSWKLSTEKKDVPISAYFSSINFGKDYLDKDLNNALDHKEVLDLISEADVLINNMKGSSSRKFGLDKDSLRKINERLIHAELTGFAGENSKVGFDIVLQAETGYLSMTGTDKEAAKLPVALIDVLAAHQMKEGILLALFLRERDGRGSHISCSLEEASLSSLSNQATNFLMQGFVAGRMGTLHPNIAPYGEVVRTKDLKEFVLAIGTQGHFERFCEFLGLGQLLKDERYADNQNRVVNRIGLHKLLQSKVSLLDSEEFEKACDSLKIPVGRIKNLDEVLTSAVAEGMILEEKIENIPTKRLKTVAFHMHR